MTNSNIMFGIGVGILLLIMLVSILGILRVRRRTYSSFHVACAGSVDNSYPDKISVKVSKDLIRANPEKIPYIVKGNSMQYANIHSDDIIFVRSISPEEIGNTLPKVTLLSFCPGNSWAASHKIRRTWRIENDSIDEDSFRNSMQTILDSTIFEQLRNELHDKCPSDEVLMQGALRSLRDFRQKHQNNYNASREGEKILISTTYRTERDRLEFSIHSSNSLQGIVTSTMRRK